MTAWVALLRGINVGGSRPVPMGALREVCARLGYAQVATYLQSGNVVFASQHDATAITEELEAALVARFGFATPVILRDGAALARTAERHPFADVEEDPARLHVFFLAGDPDPGRVAALGPDQTAPERVTVRGREVFVHYPNGMGRSKLKIELGTPATARNWRTVQALRDMLDGLKR